MRLGSKSMFGLGIFMVLFVALPIAAQEKNAEKGKTEKAKAEKVAGDIGLLDTEKNYMIVVTKDGKLVTVDFNEKTKVTAAGAEACEDGGCRPRFGGFGPIHQKR